MDRVGRQSPTVSVILPYTSTKGAEAVELYNTSEKDMLEWSRRSPTISWPWTATACGSTRSLGTLYRDATASRKWPLRDVSGD